MRAILRVILVFATFSNYFLNFFLDIEEEFRVHVKTFVDNLLSPENLVAKKINHEFVTVKNLLTFINGYWNHINGAKDFSIKTIYMVRVSNHCFLHCCFVFLGKC